MIKIRGISVVVFKRKLLAYLLYVIKKYLLLSRSHTAQVIHDCDGALILVGGFHSGGEDLVEVLAAAIVAYLRYKNDRRRYGLDEAERIIDGLREMGFSVMIGVPTHWRTLNGDTESDPRLHAIIKKCDVVMPWFVGRYNETSFSPRYSGIVPEDIAWSKANDVDYVPLAFPGFSWRNMPGNENSAQIKRASGDFLWMQLSQWLASGAEMLYIAMFDEIDEGTAIFKCAKRVPVGKSRFVPVDDDIESDAGHKKDSV